MPNPKKSQPVLIIHGGAGRKTANTKRQKQIQESLSSILLLAHKRLLLTNSLEAVTYAVTLLEDDPLFNAGTGARLQSDGHARLSASIMDGGSRKFAGVINLENIKNPILVARALLKKNDRVLAGIGAFEFAKDIGFKTFNTRTEESVRLWRKTKTAAFDTVGACALDSAGLLASATSTGGKGMEWPGRVSDSATPAGNFADEFCAISATGIGEEIMDEGLAVKIATRVRDGRTINSAFERSFKEVRLGNRFMGAIGLDRLGNVAWDFTTERMAFGWKKGNKQEIFK